MSSLIPHSLFTRSLFDMDEWMRPLDHRFRTMNTLDMFDPFDELDTTLGRNLRWLNRPDFMMPMTPRVPNKYRVSLDCQGYNAKSIKTECKNNVLHVAASEKSEPDANGDYFNKEFKKTYNLPIDAECDKLVSFMTNDGQLVIEMPLKPKGLVDDASFPKIVDGPNGTKQVNIKFSVPQGIAPENIDVSVKDRCLVIKAEDKKDEPDGFSRFNYYQQTTLPENTDFQNLKCNFENGQLTVTAPVDATKGLEYKKIPIEHKQN
jgi:HSP20 family molecular chaperone IbpA